MKQRLEQEILDEFAKAAMESIIRKKPLDLVSDIMGNEPNSEYNMTARGAYSYARAMMAERARRDEMGNVK